MTTQTSKPTKFAVAAQAKFNAALKQNGMGEAVANEVKRHFGLIAEPIELDFTAMFKEEFLVKSEWLDAQEKFAELDKTLNEKIATRDAFQKTLTDAESAIREYAAKNSVNLAVVFERSEPSLAPTRSKLEEAKKAVEAARIAWNLFRPTYDATKNEYEAIAAPVFKK